jgi:hypothetical protein
MAAKENDKMEYSKWRKQVHGQKQTMTTKNTEVGCSVDSGNKFTTVKTIYARAAVVLLALNFCVTGYVVLNMNKTTQAQIDGLTSPSANEELVTKERNTQTLPTTKSQGEESIPPTRESQ